MKAILLTVILQILCSPYTYCQSSSSTRPTTTTPAYLACQSKFTASMKGLCQPAGDCLGAPLTDICSNKNYVCCVRDTNLPVNFPESSVVTRERYYKIVGNTPRKRDLYTSLMKSIHDAKAEYCHQTAAFIAQIQGQTGNLLNFEESSSDTSKYDFDRKLGNNATGDGAKYRGRGALFLRGKANYAAISPIIAAEFGFDLLSEPDRAALPSVAFKIASWIWTVNSVVVKENSVARKGSLNQLADGTFHNFTLLTHSLTTNIKDLKNRAVFYEFAVDNLPNCKRIKRGKGVRCEIEDGFGYAVPVCLIDFKKPYCGCEGEFEVSSCPYGYNSNKQCRNPSIVKCCAEKCSSFLDLVILLDSSGSIKQYDFVKAIDFLKQLIKSLDIGENSTRVGLINFSTEIKTINKLNSIVTREGLLKKIDRIVQFAQDTNTQGALLAADREILQESQGMRPISKGVPKVVIVVTDGKSNIKPENTIPFAKNLQQRDIYVVPVGVGANVKQEELYGMASNPDDVYNVDSYDKISEIIENLARTACEKPARAVFEQPIESTVQKNSYRYFKLNLEESVYNQSLTRFSVGLQNVKGSAQLYFSFNDETPKDTKDYIQVDNRDTSFGGLIESADGTSKRRRRAVEKSLQSNLTINEKFYQINRANGENILYMGVKGFDSENEFVVNVYNRTRSNQASKQQTVKTLNLIVLVLLAISIGF